VAYRLEFVSSAQREFLRLPLAVRKRLDPHVLGLEQNPRPHGVKAMAGHKGLFRVRVGDYRILYEIDDVDHVVTVTRVRLRGSAYRGL
jgi:mRNA interferase RelE/StbE